MTPDPPKAATSAAASAGALAHEAYRRGITHDAALIRSHGLIGDEWAARQAAAARAVRELGMP
ncbi:hypothetical protein Afil01_06070 [Actinorhabdospora filicis]|uniref:Uncharacterized protein n=1 Tax=Actinorhabdospora filicis TaxID=1785913 RepID=A0A9W6W8L6_9ACTN|nr:hypothetical protein [Actinorhabdospora filicis]GLZ75800.1 hypothetical protein Afil01_06070 [Actinorhabdospora filicis]